jgi:tRNA-modifying protein YgfZ
MTDEARFLRRDFGEPQQEFAAATLGAAVFDVSNRAQLELVGPDRNQFLHNFCTNNIVELPNNRGCEAFLLNAKGRMLAHVFIFTNEHVTWVEATSGQAEFLNAHLEKYHLLEDFQLTDRSESRAQFYVTGAESLQQLGEALSNSSASVAAHVGGLENRTWTTETISMGGRSINIDLKRYDLFGSPGVFVSLDASEGDAVWDQLTSHGIQSAGQDVFRALRVEHTVPVYGIDLSEDNLAQEAKRTELAISFTKGCYLGQEPVARLNALGHVNRELTRFALKSDQVPDEPVAIFNPNKPQKEVGKITSFGWCWKRNCVIGLGLLRTQFGAAETKLPAGEIEAVVL